MFVNYNYFPIQLSLLFITVPPTSLHPTINIYYFTIPPSFLRPTTNTSINSSFNIGNWKQAKYTQINLSHVHNEPMNMQMTSYKGLEQCLFADCPNLNHFIPWFKLGNICKARFPFANQIELKHLSNNYAHMVEYMLLLNKNSHVRQL